MKTMTDEAAHAIAATRERLSGYHDPSSIDPEGFRDTGLPALKSDHGFELVIDGARHHKATLKEFAVAAVNAYATVEADVAVRIKTGPRTSRELTTGERHVMLTVATALVLA